MQTKPVEDSIPKVNDEIAVGSDLEFQYRWWRFERAIWIMFALIVILDLLGCFGRGYFAKARLQAKDGSVDVHYERIERFSTPSLLRVQFGPSVIHDGKVQLWVSEALIKALGTQRVVPQPASSVVGPDGILYTFAANAPPGSVEFALEPASPGICDLSLRVPGSEEVRMKVYVMP